MATASKRKLTQRENRYTSKLVVLVADPAALIEMMRYDSCFPSSEVEAHKIIRIINHSGAEDGSDHVIELTRVALNDNPPTIARWKSFACYVLDVRHPEEASLNDEQIRNLAAHSQNTGWSYGD